MADADANEQKVLDLLITFYGKSVSFDSVDFHSGFVFTALRPRCSLGFTHCRKWERKWGLRLKDIAGERGKEMRIPVVIKWVYSGLEVRIRESVIAGGLPPNVNR